MKRIFLVFGLVLFLFFLSCKEEKRANWIFNCTMETTLNVNGSTQTNYNTTQIKKNYWTKSQADSYAKQLEYEITGSVSGGTETVKQKVTAYGEVFD